MRRSAPLLLAVVIILCAACSRNSEYYVANGKKLAALGKYEEAALNFRKALQRQPEYGEAEYQLGLTLERLGKQPEAYQALSRAVDLLPKRDDVKVALADLSLAGYLANKSRSVTLYNSVSDISDRLLAEDASSYDGLRLKGHLALASRKPKDAVEFYSKANAAKPMQPEVVLGWVQALFQDDKPASAEDLASRLIAKDKTYRPIYEALYRYYMSVNRLADAARILKAQAVNNPTDSKSAIELAAFYAANSKEEEMQAALQRMIDNPRDFPDAHLQVGNFYSGLRRWDAALKQYHAGAAADPKQKIAYLKRIEDNWLAQGKGDQAYEVVGEILKADPTDDAAKAVNAAFLVTTRNPDNIAKAVSTLRDLVVRSPDNAVWHFYFGRSLAASGDTTGARNQFQDAIAKSPDFLPARLALAELSQALGDYKLTLQYADDILKDHPGLTQAGVLRAVSLMYFGRDYEARKQLAVLEKTAPRDRDVRLQLAALDMRDRKFRDAERRFQSLAQESTGDSRAWTGLVAAIEAQNDANRAVALLQENLAKSPNSQALRSVLAKTAAQTGKYDIAIEQYRQLEVAEPNSPQRAMDLGNVFRLKGDLPDAVSQFQKAAVRAPKDAAPQVLAGGTLILLGRKAEALESYRRALALSPRNAAVMNATAYLIAETGGDLDEALRLSQDSQRMDASQPDFTDTLGWVYFKKNMNDSAVHVFRDLTQRFPEQATFHYHLGMTLLQMGDKAEARKELKSALSRKPAEEVRRDIETALARVG
jgi:tetratricopeptide (TPR) repeat protein